MWRRINETIDNKGRENINEAVLFYNKPLRKQKHKHTHTHSRTDTQAQTNTLTQTEIIQTNTQTYIQTDGPRQIIHR